MTSLTIIRGLPGSGKSTMALSILESNKTKDMSWWEADKFFMVNGEYVWDGMKIGQAHSWCYDNVYKDLEDGKNVIVSNTFTLKRELKPYFEMIQKFGKNPTVILMQSNWGSVHGVPDGVLLNMKKRFTHDISDMFNNL